MQAQAIRAPQFGVWSTMPPATDNPAAECPAPIPPAIREKLAALRAACYNTSSLRCAQHPDVWGRAR